MKRNDTPDDPFDAALQALKSRSDEVDLSNFEHDVWSEIAIRDEADSWLRWLPVERILTPAPLTALFAMAIALGVLFGFSQAAAYGKRAASDMEERYVETIHPVMMSATHTHPH